MTQPGNCFHSSFPVWLRNKEGSCRGSHPGEDCVASSWRNLRMGDSGPERHGCPMSYLKCSCWASSLTSYICIHGLRLTTDAFTVVVLSDAMTVMYAAKVIFLFEHYPLFYFLSLKDEEIAAQATKGIAQGSLLLLSHVRLFVTLWTAAHQGFPVFHHLLEFAQAHVHWVSDAIQPSRPLSSPFPPAFDLSQHQGLF